MAQGFVAALSIALVIWTVAERWGSDITELHPLVGLLVGVAWIAIALSFRSRHARGDLPLISTGHFVGGLLGVATGLAVAIVRDAIAIPAALLILSVVLAGWLILIIGPSHEDVTE